MTLNQLRAFLAAAELGSFTAAATHLQVSQASVSELVKRLESELRAGLFIRGPRRLILTAAGQELKPHAERSVASAENGMQAVHAVNALGGGKATFGSLRNANYYQLSDLVGEFHSRHPKVQVRLVGQNSVETARGVSDGTIEAGLVVLPVAPTNLSIVPLLRDEVFLVSQEVIGTSLTINDLAQRPLILYDSQAGGSDPTRRQLFERAQLAGVTIEPIIEVEYVETALDLVARGIGETIACGAVMASFAQRVNLRLTSLHPALYDTIALVQKRGHPISPATRELVELARESILRGRPATQVGELPTWRPPANSGQQAPSSYHYHACGIG